MHVKDQIMYMTILNLHSKCDELIVSIYYINDSISYFFIYRFQTTWSFQGLKRAKRNLSVSKSENIKLRSSQQTSLQPSRQSHTCEAFKLFLILFLGNIIWYARAIGVFVLYIPTVHCLFWPLATLILAKRVIMTKDRLDILSV